MTTNKYNSCFDYMYNHSNIWQNITMIIFLMFLLIIFIITLIKFKVIVNLEIDGTKSYIFIRFLFWKIERNGKFSLIKKKNKVDYSEYKKVKNINEKKKNLNIKNKRSNILKNKFRYFNKFFENNETNNKILKFLKKILKKIRFDKLEIQEEIGFLEPNLTAYLVPAMSIITLIPIKVLDVNLKKFKYKITPFYTDLRFRINIKAEVSFRVIKIIFSIITEKMHKLFYSKEVDFR